MNRPFALLLLTRAASTASANYYYLLEAGTG